MEPSSLSVIFSFRNEEENLPELLRRTLITLKAEKAASRLNVFELIFVNDASTDRSLELLKKASESDPEIKVITMSRAFGNAPCILAGMEQASGDAVIYMDADLQDPPELIPALLAQWKEQKQDIIHTLRTHREGESWSKLAVTRIGYWILNRATPFNLPIECGDFKLLSRRAVQNLVQLREKRPFVRGLTHWIGFNHGFLPYRRETRYSGQSKFPLFSPKVIENFFYSALVSFTSSPLNLASYAGFATGGVATLLLIHVLFEKLQGNNIPGWTAIMAAILFLGSIQLICIGIMGVYLSNIHEESKGRPNYIIAETLGFDRTDPAPK